MRMTLKIDSATADEAHDFIFAYQRAMLADDKSTNTMTQPTVQILGVGWHVTTPPLTHEQANELLADFNAARISIAAR